jgi:hypothetical protein
VLVPYWRALPAPDFLAWFRENEPRLVAFYGPLQVATALVAVAAAAVCRRRRRGGSGLLGTAALLAVGVLGLYPLYFRDVNASFVAGTVAPDAVGAELGRWSAWQRLRIGLGVGAFVVALLAVRRSETRRISSAGRGGR